MPVGVAPAPGHCPHPLELLCFGVQISHTHLGLTTSCPRAFAGVGVGRRVVMVESFRSLPSRGLLQAEEAEQGEENDGAGSGSSSPPSPWGRS